MAAKLKPRLPSIPDHQLSDRQKELMESIRSGPRGRVSQGGPFGVYLHAPDFGDLTQKLGAQLSLVKERMSNSSVCAVRTLSMAA